MDGLVKKGNEATIDENQNLDEVIAEGNLLLSQQRAIEEEEEEEEELAVTAVEPKAQEVISFKEPAPQAEATGSAGHLALNLRNWHFALYEAPNEKVKRSGEWNNTPSLVEDNRRRR